MGSCPVREEGALVSESYRCPFGSHAPAIGRRWQNATSPVSSVLVCVAGWSFVGVIPEKTEHRPLRASLSLSSPIPTPFSPMANPPVPPPLGLANRPGRKARYSVTSRGTESCCSGPSGPWKSPQALFVVYLVLVSCVQGEQLIR